MFGKRKRLLLHALATATAVGAVALSAASALAVTFPIQVVFDGSTTVIPITSAAAGSTQAPATYPYASFVTRNATQFGSGTGRCDLLWGNIDVADSSGNISSGDNQYNGANSPGTIPPATATNCDQASPTKAASGQITPFTTSQIDDWVIAHDGVIPVVNSSTLQSTITNLTRQNLADIYDCTVTDWHTLNSAIPAGTTIKPIARDLASGTRQTWLDLLKNYGLTDANEQSCITAAGTTRATGNPNVQTEVSSTPNAIGYVGLGFDSFSGLNPITVEGVAGNSTTILNGTYPLSRVLHMMTLQYAVTPRLQSYSGAIDFVNYVLSPAGQADVSNAGFIPLQNTTASIPDWDINVDGITNVNDVVIIGQNWLLQSGNTNGAHWIRADVNRDNIVNVNDIATVGQHWLSTWSKAFS